MSQGPSRTSDILMQLAAGTEDRISVRQIVAALGERTYALLIVVLGLPNCLPMPPPIPLISGILLFFVALQLVVGWPSPWLPRRLLDRTLARDVVSKAAARALPWLVWLERAARPRLVVFHSEPALRVMGVVLLAFSLALVFAAPFIGQIPLGLAVCLVGLGLVERDGYVVVSGLAVGMVGTSLSLGFVFAVIASATAIF
ncbi:exopolysaccharide biosynthesis protein [Alsobacter sp. SYSU M60028]|uniref:Exopolysaccharide biosynthesis protein n=1 Tax=Alsobacter ponti TaxID=2962936 RepID=A0ABT1LJN1_9HYPH|nr:exopolysaccharide biosynthesis protein [Alsobacter ponti]MCP8940458.1 exopolysaccharide biosynthesis protein [Alsobacter ponti]